MLDTSHRDSRGNGSGDLDHAVLIAQQGDQTALARVMLECEPIVLRISRPFFLQGGDTENLLQEARVGLLKAIRDYRPSEAPAGFRAFAILCTKRQVITAVKAASRQKHIPLNHSASLSEPVLPDSSLAVEDQVTGDPFRDFCEEIACRETAEAIRRGLREALSMLERRVMGLYLAGFSREEIGEALGRGYRSVEHALYRAKNKVRAFAQRHLEVVPGGAMDLYWYWGSLRSRVFHLPHCRLVPAAQNRVRLDSWSGALAQGFSPCTVCSRAICRPDGAGSSGTAVRV